MVDKVKRMGPGGYLSPRLSEKTSLSQQHSRSRLEEGEGLSQARSRAISFPGRGNACAKALRHIPGVGGPVWLEESRIKGRVARHEDLEVVRSQAM